jgi:hypothetical protein
VKHAVTAAVVATWLGMVALLVHRQMPAPATDLASLPPAPEGVAPSREEWFGVYQGEHKIGHAHRTVSRTASGGYHFEETMGLRLAMLGSSQPLDTTLTTDTDAGLTLQGFRFSLGSPAATFTASGTSDGHTLSISHGPQGDPVVIPLDEPLNLPSTLRPRIVAARPEPGARFTHAVLSPITFQKESITITVEGRETIDGHEALRIAEEHQGMRARAWLDEDGGVLREEGVLGFVLRREPRATALAGSTADAPLDLALAAKVPLAGAIADPRGRTTLSLRVTGDARDRVPSDPPRQQVAGDVLTVVRETMPERALPPPADGTLGRYLDPSPFIESDDPGIVAAARTIVAGETDPGEKVRLLLRWLRESMTREPSLTVPSAREVLQTRRGDCNEHAVLLAALARAAGIPARVAAGVVYLDDGFYYHAWNELWLGRWVSADAVFDQMPVDATHVKLVEGGPEQHLGLAALLGRLGFATVERAS